MPPAGNKRSGPRRATQKHLQNAAEHYLARFATSTENLRRVLMRKVWRSAQVHETDADKGAAHVEEIIARCRDLGYLDDQAYADMRVRGLRGRGVSARMIRQRLKEKGIEAETADAAVTRFDDEDGGHEPDFQAAVRLARRRRLGPFDMTGTREERREKQLAALARAGFGYDVARRVIEAPSAEELLAEAGLDD